TGSCSSVFQLILTAPGMWPPSYAVVSSSTSTKTTWSASRFCSAQSAVTRADSRLMSVLSPRERVFGRVESTHGSGCTPPCAARDPRGRITVRRWVCEGRREEKRRPKPIGLGRRCLEPLRKHAARPHHQERQH